jgi:hypothetical protein
MINFYRCFLPNCAQVQKTLTDLLRVGGQNIGKDCLCPGGLPKCKTPPGSGGAPPTSCAQC